MKTTTILIALLLLTACERDRRYYQVTCDSGFKTPVSTYTWINSDGGVIVWREHRKGSISKRKMLPGEICTETKLVIKG